MDGNGVALDLGVCGGILAIGSGEFEELQRFVPALADEAFAHVMKTESGFVAFDCDFVEQGA